MFENGSEFERDLIPFLEDLCIKSVLTTIKNPQDNSTVERLYQVIFNMLVTKDIDNKVFDYN